MDLNGLKDDVFCPECYIQLGVTPEQIKRGDTVICPECQNSVRLLNKDDHLNELDKSLKDDQNKIEDARLNFEI
jgi:DNA-directed RNA polymerase subunit M/transcription elongation factor TFIIS